MPSEIILFSEQMSSEKGPVHTKDWLGPDRAHATWIAARRSHCPVMDRICASRRDRRLMQQTGGGGIGREHAPPRQFLGPDSLSRRESHQGHSRTWIWDQWPRADRLRCQIFP